MTLSACLVVLSHMFCHKLAYTAGRAPDDNVDWLVHGCHEIMHSDSAAPTQEPRAVASMGHCLCCLRCLKRSSLKRSPKRCNCSATAKATAATKARWRTVHRRHMLKRLAFVLSAHSARLPNQRSLTGSALLQAHAEVDEIFLPLVSDIPLLTRSDGRMSTLFQP